MTVKRVILIRPGETDWNKAGRWQGWVAVPLNEHGKQQARALARYIRNIGISALYASDLQRARETADLLAENLGFAPVYDARLRERSIGQWQGLTLDEMKAWYPDEYQALLQDRSGYIIPGGESRADMRKRMIEAFNAYLAEARGETIGILSHSSAIRTLLMEWIPEAELVEAEISNTSVTTIALNDDGTWRIVAANDVMHLEGLATKSFEELEGTRQ
jgi:2,3-bisphosphoglycerate-dependent phosphoglycerate mutase